MFREKKLKNIFLRLAYLVVTIILLYVPFGCKKENNVIVNTPQFDSILDIDSNYYKIVKIGNQWWMAENLAVKSFNDGTPIRNAESDEFWKEPVSSYCKYKNDVNAPGLLYNWYAVNDARKIAPAGWHVATEEDWQKLESFIGMSETEITKIGWRGTTEGSKLKIYGRTGWLTEVEEWPTNESGFSAEAGACRKQNGVWGEPGLTQTGFWWTATASESGKAYYRYLDYKNTRIFRHDDFKNCGLSIRCVKD